MLVHACVCVYLSILWTPTHHWSMYAYAHTVVHYISCVFYPQYTYNVYRILHWDVCVCVCVCARVCAKCRSRVLLEYRWRPKRSAERNHGRCPDPAVIVVKSSWWAVLDGKPAHTCWHLGVSFFEAIPGATAFLWWSGFTVLGTTNPFSWLLFSYPSLHYRGEWFLMLTWIFLFYARDHCSLLTFLKPPHS